MAERIDEVSVDDGAGSSTNGEAVIPPRPVEEMVAEYLAAKQKISELSPLISEGMIAMVPERLRNELRGFTNKLCQWGGSGHQWENRHLEEGGWTREDLEAEVEKLRQAWEPFAVVKAEEWMGIGGGLSLTASLKKLGAGGVLVNE